MTYVPCTQVEDSGGFASMGRATRIQNCTVWVKRPLQLGGGEAKSLRIFRKQKIRLLGLLASCHTQARASLTPSPVYRGR